MCVLRYLEVEARIVDEDDHVRLPLTDVLLAHLHIAENGGQVHQYGDESHIGQFAVVLHQRSSHGSHLVAAKEAKLRLRVLVFQRLHQVRGM